MNKTIRNIVIVLVTILVLATVWYVYALQNTSPSPIVPGRNDDTVFCTMEAKLCPDGSYVGRQGPKCEFAPCPTASDAKVQVELE